MNFFIDFEATQPEQEIISIGVIAENGNTFYTLVKPQLSTISPFITQMTGIRPVDVEAAPNFTFAMERLYAYCAEQEPRGVCYWNFYSYANADKVFLNASLETAMSEKSILLTCFLISMLKDYSQTVTRYFHCGVSLIKAFNYVDDLEEKQRHNALEDAKMLAELYSKIEGKDPLPANPFDSEKETTSYIFPSGRFFCKGMGKNAIERQFSSIENAIEWLISINIPEKEREAVHRDRIATKIMKAIRKNSSYMGYRWRRVK